MAWYSLLPEYLKTWESWISRFFILLGILMIGPWAAFVVFDLVYYVIRVVSYEIPIIGGRAQGQRRPRAPSLTERPSGRRRAFSLRGETQEGIPSSSSSSTKAPPEGLKSRHTQTQGEDH
ncbi:hypothetical protein BGW36DRAFT_302088 [Talaromyces proteolyticus]|uniref:Uncharacterized protein n=1 Tax=Talaromyces proteolyticus TaxID=1131652 RepID=A0AAD4KJP4_9EURO|nr:uncharacterized protein BGW36DRAFT_302088 [Talaromyces proteolyticus]KAH8692623.1 hypothetical protein BGW36DRAFT_302088 [Talaromyces proteolyticus]